MPGSPEYERIKEAIQDTTTTPSFAIHAKFKSDLPADKPRKMLAYVLGGDQPGNAGNEAVLIFQYAGDHMSPDPKRNWRCFKVADLRHPTNSGSAIKVEKIPLNLGAGDPTPPPPLTPPQVARQNCVLGGIGTGVKIVRSAPYHT